MVLVRGQLRRLRGQQDRQTRRGGGPSAPRDPPPPHALIFDSLEADLSEPEHQIWCSGSDKSVLSEEFGEGDGLSVGKLGELRTAGEAVSQHQSIGVGSDGWQQVVLGNLD